jgi:hypothetical protein
MTVTIARKIARPGLVALLSSAAMVLALHGAASAAELPQRPGDPPRITKAPPKPATLPGHYKLGDVDIAISGVATIGTSIRTTDRNPILVPPLNGKALGIFGTAVGGANADDGELNWNQGSPVSTVAKAFVTFDANYQNKAGVFVRAMAWYDYTLANQAVRWGNTSGGYLLNQPLSQNGWDPGAKAFGIIPQEAYGWVKNRVGDMPVEARAGDIIVPWGLPTMIPGGFTFAMNAVNYAALNRPGAQPEEIFAPTPGTWGRIALSDHATLEAFGLFQGPKSIRAGCGTLYAAADWNEPGCNNVVFGPFSDPAALAAGFDITKAPTPDNHDAQFGIGGSYFLEPIGTKFGVYYSHVDNPLSSPATIVSTPTVSTFAPFAPGNPQYFMRYAEGVNAFAVNFTTQHAGTTLYGEYVYEPNAPIQLNAADVLNALLSPVAPTQLRAQYASAAPGSIVNAYDRLQVGNLLVGGRQVLPAVFGAKAFVVGGEVGVKSVYDLPDPNVRRYGRVDVFGLGPVTGFPCTGPAYQCSLNGYVSPLAVGYRLTSSLRYEDVFHSGLTVTPTVGISHDVSGWSYDGVFSQGRVLLNLKLRAEYANRYFTEFAWNPALRTGPYDSLSDRQVLSIATGVKF